MLKEQDRSKLDSIVSQMESNGEKPDDIQFVVNDFKTKYDTPEQPQQEQVAPKEEGFLDRSTARNERIYKPTTLGKALGYEAGRSGIEDVAEGIVGAPERAFRLAGGAVGDIVDAGTSLLGGVANAVTLGGTKKLGAIASKGLGNVAQKALQAPMINKGAQAAQSWWESQPEDVKANIGASMDMAQGIGLGKTAELAAPLIKSAGGKLGNIAKTTVENVGNMPIGIRGDATIGGTIKKLLPENATKIESKLNKTIATAIETPGIIPDIDDAKTIGKITGDKLLTAKAINENLKGEYPKIKTPLLSGISEKEAFTLHKPLTSYDTPFTEYAYQAKKAMKSPDEMTAFDIIGQKAANEVMPEITKIKNSFGEAKSNILTTKGDARIDLSDLPDQFSTLIKERLGLTIGDNGKIVTAPGRAPRKPGEISTINDLWETIKSNSGNVPAQMADDLKSQIRDKVYTASSMQIRPTNTISEGIGKQIAKSIDDKLDNALGKEYAIANQNYSNTLKIEKEFNKRLGEMAVEGGPSRLAAGLMKSVIQSNSDKGTKSLFNAIKEITGYDLIKEAHYAEIASRAVGDERALNLLKEAGLAASALTGNVTGLASAAGSKGLGKILEGRKSIDAIVDYYNKVHGGLHPKNDLGTIVEESKPAWQKKLAADIAQGNDNIDPMIASNIAKQYGLKYNGMQEGVGAFKPTALFTDMNSGNTFAARTVEEFNNQLKKYGVK